MKPVRLFRKRYFPDELIELKDDKILFQDDSLLVTKWDVLKPRKDIASGYSAYFIKKGIKLSRVLNQAGELVYWYCDIIHTCHDEAENTYTFHDLLVDVLIYPDGSVRVVDLDELADIMRQNILSKDIAADALLQTDTLLRMIYGGRFSELTEPIMKFISR